MGWFLLIITTIFIGAIVTAIIYFILNIIFNASSSSKANSIISFIVCVIMLIILLCIKDEPKFENGEFETGSVGLIAVSLLTLIFPISNAMINLMEGDDVLQGIGQSVGVLAVCSAISIIILCFASTFWPLIALTIVGGISSVVTFFRVD